MTHFPLPAVALFLSLFAAFGPLAGASPEEREENKIEIIEGEDKVIYEYRQNGVLTLIKVAPKNGRAYYMAPLDGAPLHEGLDHKHKLYPRWVILEW